MNKTVGEIIQDVLLDIANQTEGKEGEALKAVREFIKTHEGDGLAGLVAAVAVYLLLKPEAAFVLRGLMQTIAPVVMAHSGKVKEIAA